MTILLSPSQKLTIRAAIKDVTDTFFVTPVTYKLGIDSIDRANEDRTDMDYTTYNLSGMAEYNDTKKEGYLQGDASMPEIKVTFNMEDLITAGLIDAEKMPIFNELRDIFIVNGHTYTHFKAPYPDGPLDKQNCLVIIEGKKQERNT